MRTRVLNYRIIVTPDTQTGTGKKGYTALCPTLGVADDGDTIDKAIQSVKGAIQVFVDSLVEDNKPVPVDEPDQDLVTTTQIKAPASFRFAWAMPKLPQIKPSKIEKVLIKLGFSSRKGKGSHVVFKHSDGRRTVIPAHNRPIRIGTLRAVLKQIDLTTQEFLDLL